MLQEIFIKIYRNSTTFDRRLTASSWIYRIAHNMAVSGWRKRQARPQTIGGAEAEQIWEGIAGDDNPLHTVDAGIMAAAVQTVLKRINHRHRTVLILRYLEDKRYEEISDILQVPPGTVATWLNRAKKEFKKVYTQKP
jgi:RNA polymerase sigma-70 factor (ECF subfamily)